MPKVSNFNVRVDGVTHVFDVHYNKRDSFHVKNFPTDVLNASSNNHYPIICNHETEMSLITAIKNAVNVYHEITSSQRKIIIYNLYASTEIRMNKIREGAWSGCREGISDNVRDIQGGSDVFSIGFDYDVLFEVKKNDLIYYNCLPGDKLGYRRQISRDSTIIDWTEAREKAFESLGVNMHLLMVKMCAVLGDAERAMKFIDNGIKLLS